MSETTLINQRLFPTKIYISLDQSILVNNRKVTIGDIASIFCTDLDIKNTVSKIEITTLTNTKQDQVVISAMKLIELISMAYKDIIIENIGETETIVYYKNTSITKKYEEKFKALLLMILAFFGTSYSIMAYNCDVGTDELLEKLYTLFTGKTEISSTGLLIAALGYSIGLCIGLIIFFNHGINTKNEDDPTPLQVQMRMYEQDVNSCIITDSSRKNKTIDVD